MRTLLGIVTGAIAFVVAIGVTFLVILTIIAYVLAGG